MQTNNSVDNSRTYHLTSAVCSAEEYSRLIIDDKYKSAQAAIKFFRVFLDGFVKNGKTVKVFSKRPVSRKTSGERYIRSKKEVVDGVQYHYSRLFNMRYIGNLYSLLSSFFWYLSGRNCKRGDIVFIDPLNVAISFGTAMACKLRGIKTVGIITDVPECYVYSSGKNSRALKMSRRVNKMADAYVFLTEAMNEVVNPTGKPYLVVEGFVHSDMKDAQNTLDEKYEKKVCMYTGGVEKIYGLDMLVDGFLYADVPDSELHIYGAGKFAKELSEYSERDARIKYLGCRDNSEVVLEQMKATLLINPRYTDAEFTKYSFPSKTSEYIVSATPTLTTRLPGIPPEYFEHVFALDREDAEGMGEKIREILSMTREELHEFGLSAKSWILENKNDKMQISRIIEFINEKVSK